MLENLWVFPQETKRPSKEHISNSLLIPVQLFGFCLLWESLLVSSPLKMWWCCFYGNNDVVAMNGALVTTKSAIYQASDRAWLYLWSCKWGSAVRNLKLEVCRVRLSSSCGVCICEAMRVWLRNASHTPAHHRFPGLQGRNLKSVKSCP